MMTEAQKKMVEALGLTERDFRPPEQTDAQRIAELEAQNQMLTQWLMEMSQIVYA